MTKGLMKAFYYYSSILSILLVLLSASHFGYVTSAPSPSSLYYTTTSFDNKTEEIPEIIKVIPFNNTYPSSILVDPISNLVYVSVRPDHPYSYFPDLCSGQSTAATLNNLSSSNHVLADLCSVIYVLDGDTDRIIEMIGLGPGEEIHDMDIDHGLGTIYATGEYNYLVNDSKGNAEQVQREDDVVYVISNISNTSGHSENDTINAERITLYGEIEEGKEGDMSDIAVDTNDNIKTIYAGIRYYQGGREGIFIIPDSRIVSKLDRINNNNLSNTIKFIPLGSTGPEQIFVNDQMNTIYALLEYDNFIAIIDGSINDIKEKIIMQNPRAMSINPSAGLLYVASGDSFWFNIVDMTIHKVIGVNTQISYPVASAVNNLTGRVFVAECLECDDFDFTNGTSIYALDSNGSTINWNTYENINIKENGLAVNPFTNKLYAIGTNTKSELSNLYVIDISSR
jgi:DNA-binding beta-propeller fold protein YncE